MNKQWFSRFTLGCLLIALVSLVLTGCGGGGSGNTPSSSTVYIAGYCYDGAKAIPCYWTVTGSGVVRTDLLPGSDGSGYAESVFVAGETVYIGGYYYVGSDASPCYWTITGGGSPGLTAFGPAKSYVESIYVYGNAVYTAGYDWSGLNYLPCCWRGDTAQIKLPLPAGAVYGEALSVFGTDENTAYTAGWYFDGSKDNPCYWIAYWGMGNSDRKDLPAPEGHGGQASSVSVSGNTVYTAGWCYTSTGIGVPCYWVNQDNPTVLSLPGGATYGYANSISFSGGTVYAAGYCSDGTRVTPCYWTGASPTALPLPTGVTKGWASSVSVSGGIVYTAGYYEDANGNDIPCYWRGTVRTDLPLEGAISGRAAGAFAR